MWRASPLICSQSCALQSKETLAPIDNGKKFHYFVAAVMLPMFCIVLVQVKRYISLTKAKGKYLKRFEKKVYVAHYLGNE